MKADLSFGARVKKYFDRDGGIDVGQACQAPFFIGAPAGGTCKGGSTIGAWPLPDALQMKAADLDALVAYLRSLPVK